MHTLEQLRSGQLAGLRRLQLSCGLTAFPREIFELADTLEILDLSGNALSALPDDLPRLHKLRILFCSNNTFTRLPTVLGACPALSMVGFKSNQIHSVPAAALAPTLRWLILTDNVIEQLPASIGRCTQLQKLMLAGNRLRTLPPQLAACTQLELVRIAANALTTLPDWLLTLPRLSWLAYAGNPFCAALLPESPSPSQASIAWDSLQLGEQLGAGASGVIHAATWRHADDVPAAAVAVKVFKGALTSDGLPDCELAAWLSAGQHANLIPVLGALHGHPDGAQGCVMPLIDDSYTNLAGPPSLDSCTRDCYAEQQSFSAAQLLGIASGIAGAVHHLHQRGILHGDLYAHNILYQRAGRCLLGDFGAASCYLPDGPLAAALQRLEVRAYGVLLDELMARCALPAAWQAPLAALRESCLRNDPATRPTLAEVEQRLTALAALAALVAD